MKTLTFDSKELYENVYEAFSASDGHSGAAKVRSIGKIFTVLDSIGEPRAGELGVQGLKTLKIVPATVELEDADFALLAASIMEVRWVNALAAKKAAVVFDWFDEIAKAK